MAQSPGQAFAYTGCWLKERSTRVLPGKAARVCNCVSSALVSGNTAKLGKRWESVGLGRWKRAGTVSVCAEHRTKRKGEWLNPTSSHLPLGYLLGHSLAERLRMGNASVCASAESTENERKLKEPAGPRWNKIWPQYLRLGRAQPEVFLSQSSLLKTAIFSFLYFIP